MRMKSSRPEFLMSSRLVSELVWAGDGVVEGEAFRATMSAYVSWGLGDSTGGLLA